MAEGSPNTIVYKVAAGAVVAGVIIATTNRGPSTGQGRPKYQPLGIGETRGFNMSAESRALVKPLAVSQARGGTTRTLDSNTIVIYYDSAGQYGYLGDLYSKQVAQLLTHFDFRVERIPVEQYQAGDLAKPAANFYLGVLYGNPLPPAFMSEVVTSQKPMCWMGYNLWQVAWNANNTENTAFSSSFGFRFLGLDTLGYSTVSYKGVDLIKEQYDPTEGKIEVLDASKAKVLATSKRDDGLTMPYITRSGSFWYVADNPLSYISWKKNCDRALAFYDTIHDVVGSKAAEEHRAFLRIEDVSPNVPPATLKALADTLAAENIPYIVCVIPSYRNYEVAKGNPNQKDVDKNVLFTLALHYMELKGAQIVMHGYTHQYSTVENPYNSESATDYEFFRVSLDSTGVEVPQGPIPEDSGSWAGKRLDAGLDMLQKSGFKPKGWVTPHYIASPVDYAEIAKRFDYAACRSLTYASGPDGKQYYIQLWSPWVTRDMFGIKHIPETIGYVDPTGYAGIPPRLPADVVGYAKAQKVVRDGWAGCYFHWFLDPSMLKDLVDGVKAQGFRFVAPSGNTR